MANKCSANAANNHLGKYAASAAKNGGGFVAYPFAYSAHTLALNTAKSAIQPKPGTVQGTICGMVAQAKTPLTGAALLALMLAYNWQSFAGRTGHINPSTGKASAQWCVGYINGIIARANKGHLPLVATVAAPAPVAPTKASAKA